MSGVGHDDKPDIAKKRALQIAGIVFILTGAPVGNLIGREPTAVHIVIGIAMMVLIPLLVYGVGILIARARSSGH